jgi:hypothetical protein
MNAFAEPEPRFTLFDDCAFYATELFAMATSPLSIDVWSSDRSRCKIERSDRTSCALLSRHTHLKPLATVACAICLESALGYELANRKNASR